jgi:ADP-ribose pyrophosphatase YjhB (NUDIX family)
MITCKFENGSLANLRHVAVHALVYREGEILLTKRAGNIPETGKWCIPGGYMNRDENGEQAVLRELHEETGWDGEVIRLFRVNSNPFRNHEVMQNVILEYLIKPLGITGNPDHETSKVEWIPFTKLLAFGEFAFDHGDSIKLLLKYLDKPFALPLVG